MIFSYLLNMQSHPSWVCGLKLEIRFAMFASCASHPSWVCGLKQQTFAHAATVQGVTPFVGVWIETNRQTNIKYLFSVTPFVGVWIET